MKVIALFISFFFLTDVFIWWCGTRILRRNRARREFVIAFHFFMLFQIAAQATIVYCRSRNMDVDAIFPLPLMIATFIWHLILAPVALVLNLLELLRESVRALVQWWRERKARRLTAGERTEKHPEQEWAEEAFPKLDLPEPCPSLGGTAGSAPGSTLLSRRQFLSAAVALTPPLFTVSISAVASEQIRNFRIRRLTVFLPQLPPELEGATIAHLSDTHVGRFSHGEVLKKISDATNALKADLVVFTGDLINDSLTWLPDALEMLKAIEQPIYLCEGNHDLIVDPFEFRSTVKATPGLTLLLHETKTVRLRGVPVQLMGLCWGGPHRSERKQFGSEFTLERSTEQLLRLRDPNAFPILLAHHPHAWDHAKDVPLTLSGHTHGGQLMLNERLGVGPIMFRYWTGLYTRPESDPNSAGTLAVSNGVGNWFPLRVSAPAEIIHLTLRRPV